MDKRELNMYSLEETVSALLDGTPVKQIARLQKISKNTVKKYRTILEGILASQPSLRGDLPAVMCAFRLIRSQQRYSANHGWLEANTALVEKLTAKCDNYVRLFQVLQEHGFRGSYSSLQRYVSKSELFKEKPVFRIESNPGEIAQVDFGSIGMIYDEDTGVQVKAYVFVMVLGFSRDAYYEIVKHQDILTWCSCHIHAFEHFNGVPGIIIPDNLKSAIIKASYMDPLANKSYSDLAKHYGFQIDPCLPGTPEHKGKVESGVKYAKNNFLPLRSFANFADANRQLQEWNTEIARVRIHGTTRRKPEELFDLYEKDALGKLALERFEIPVWKHLKVYRDIHIQFDKAYYSVPYELRGEYVEARKTDSQVAVFYDNELVAVHSPAPTGKRRTNRDHYPAEIRRYMEHDVDYCIQQALSIGPYTHRIVKSLLKEEAIRNLRSAQNIIRLKKKFDLLRLELACKRAVYYGNYTYGGIKNILEKQIDKQDLLFEEDTRQLCSRYARDLPGLLSKEVSLGNIRTN
jgi:transposase